MAAVVAGLVGAAGATAVVGWLLQPGNKVPPPNNDGANNGGDKNEGTEANGQLELQRNRTLEWQAAQVRLMLSHDQLFEKNESLKFSNTLLISAFCVTFLVAIYFYHTDNQTTMELAATKNDLAIAKKEAFELAMELAAAVSKNLLCQHRDSLL